MINTLTEVEPKNYFKLGNGQIIKSIHELPFALASINEEVFRMHVTAYKNDFAKWIYDVFRLEQLPKEIGHVKSKEELSRIVKAYLMQRDYTNSNKYLPEKVIPQRQAQETVTIQQTQQNISEKKQEEPKPDSTIKYAEPISSIKQQSRKIYVWKTNESMLLSQRPKKPLDNEPKKEIQKPIEPPKEVNKVEEPKRIEPKEIIQEQKELPNIISKVEEKPITDADEYFEKNPVLMSQFVAARKRTQEVEQLELLHFTGQEQGAKLIELFKDTYAKAYQKMSTLRKIGYDTSLTEMMLFRIPTKIKMYEASLEEKEAITVKRYINEAIEELNNMK